MRKINSFALLAVLALVGCATQSTPVDRFPAFTAAKPRSILIVPVVNNSVDVTASTSVLSTLPKVLAERGYYVFPVNTVKTLLEFEGLYEPHEIHQENSVELAELFGADAILYVSIHKWTSEYVFVQATTIVDLEYNLVSSAGVQLWAARKAMSYSPSDYSGSKSSSGLEILVAAAVSAAFERAAPNYLPLTRKANEEVFETDIRTALPPGPYAPNYDTYYQALEPKTQE